MNEMNTDNVMIPATGAVATMAGALLSKMLSDIDKKGAIFIEDPIALTLLLELDDTEEAPSIADPQSFVDKRIMDLDATEQNMLQAALLGYGQRYDLTMRTRFYLMDDFPDRGQEAEKKLDGLLRSFMDAHWDDLRDMIINAYGVDAMLENDIHDARMAAVASLKTKLGARRNKTGSNAKPTRKGRQSPLPASASGLESGVSG